MGLINAVWRIFGTDLATTVCKNNISMKVNMPADSFESPLTLAACGGHVELAMLLLERGANIEEVNDEGYTPLMEASREGHEEMVALLLSQGREPHSELSKRETHLDLLPLVVLFL